MPEMQERNCEGAFVASFQSVGELELNFSLKCFCDLS